MPQLSNDSIAHERLKGKSWQAVAMFFDVSTRTLLRYRNDNNYADPFEENVVRSAIRNYSNSFPNAGENTIRGLLLSEDHQLVKRQHLRRIINEEDGAGRQRRK